MSSMHPRAAVPQAVRGGCNRGSRRSGLGRLVEHRARVLSAIAALSILVGGVLHLAGHGAGGDGVWRAAVALLAAELAVSAAR